MTTITTPTNMLASFLTGGLYAPMRIAAHRARMFSDIKGGLPGGLFDALLGETARNLVVPGGPAGSRRRMTRRCPRTARRR